MELTFSAPEIFPTIHNDMPFLCSEQDSMEFLHDIVPKKITFAKYLEMIKNDKDNNDNSDEIM